MNLYLTHINMSGNPRFSFFGTRTRCSTICEKREKELKEDQLAVDALCNKVKISKDISDKPGTWKKKVLNFHGLKKISCAALDREIA